MSSFSLPSDTADSPLPPCLVCRSDPGLRSLSILLFVLGFPCLLWALCDPSSLKPSDSRVFTFIGALSCLISFGLGLGTLRTRIIADEHGLRWRKLGRWHRALWPQVRGYYLSPILPSTKIIVTAGDTLKYDLTYTHAATLTKIIEQRALDVPERVWHEYDSGLDAGVCEFTYQDSSRNTFLVHWGPSLAGALVFLGLLVGVNSGGRFFLLLPFALIVFFPFAFGLWMLYQIAAEAQLRTGQRISVDPEGISFQRSDHDLYAPWDDVTDYYLTLAGVTPRVPIRHVVVTRYGTFDFVRMHHGRRLCSVIARYATNAPQRRWRLHSTTDDFECHQTEPDGAFTFSYRTRSVRSLLWATFILTFFCALLLPLTQWSDSLSPESPHSSSTLLLLIFFGLPILACSASYWFYTASHIRLDEHGITKRTPRRTTFLKWSAMRVLSCTPQQGYWVSDGDDNTAIYLSNFRPVDFDFLCQEVARRSGLEWHEQSKKAEQNPASNV